MDPVVALLPILVAAIGAFARHREPLTFDAGAVLSVLRIRAA